MITASTLIKDDLPALVSTGINTYKVVDLTEKTFITDKGLIISKEDCIGGGFLGLPIIIPSLVLDNNNLRTNDLVGTNPNFIYRFMIPPLEFPGFNKVDLQNPKCLSFMYNKTLNTFNMLLSISDDGQYVIGINLKDIGDASKYIFGVDMEETLTTVYDIYTLDQQDLDYYDVIGTIFGMIQYDE